MSILKPNKVHGVNCLFSRSFLDSQFATWAKFDSLSLQRSLSLYLAESVLVQIIMIVMHILRRKSLYISEIIAKEEDITCWTLWKNGTLLW